METDTKQLSWKHDRVLEFLSLWRSHPNLYDRRHKLYSNKRARQEALESIAQQMNVSMPELTVSDVKTKMMYLRSQYCRELHKYPSNDNEDETINFPYWYDSMSFIRKFVRVRSLQRDTTEQYDLRSSKGETTIGGEPTPAKRPKSSNKILNRSNHLQNSQFNLTSPKDTISIPDMPPIVNHLTSSDLPPISTNVSNATSSSDEISIVEMPLPIKDNIIDISADSSSALQIYKTDPGILESFQRHLSSTVTSSQPTTNHQRHLSSNPTIISINKMENEYDQTFMSFVKANMAMITDPALKDELMDKITMILLEYKVKQRNSDR